MRGKQTGFSLSQSVALVLAITAMVCGAMTFYGEHGFLAAAVIQTAVTPAIIGTSKKPGFVSILGVVIFASGSGLYTYMYDQFLAGASEQGSYTTFALAIYTVLGTILGIIIGAISYVALWVNSKRTIQRQ